MNNISITLSADASPTVIERAHATIDAFFGRITNAQLADLAPATAQDHATATIEQHAAAPAPSGPVELDADGLPWDERIHASTKTKTQKNQWTKRKGVDDAMIAKVLAELRSTHPIPAAAPLPADITPHPTITAPTIKIVPKTKYQELCDFLAANASSPKLTQEVIKATFEQNGTTLAKLAGDEAGSAAFLEAFTTFLAG